MNKILPETTGLIKELQKVAVNEIMTYSKLESIIKCNPQIGHGRGMIYTAFRHVIKNDGYVFICLPNIGYKRIVNDDVVDYSETWIKKTRRAANKASKIATTVNYDELSEDSKIKHNTNLSVFGAVKLFTKPTNVKKLQQGVMDKKEELTINKDVLRIFE